MRESSNGYGHASASSGVPADRGTTPATHAPLEQAGERSRLTRPSEKIARRRARGHTVKRAPHSKKRFKSALRQQKPLYAVKTALRSKNRFTQQNAVRTAARKFTFFGAEMIASLTKWLRAAQNVCACLSLGNSLRARAIAFGQSKLLAQFERLGPPVASASRSIPRPARSAS